jgi:hypothetical protein
LSKLSEFIFKHWVHSREEDTANTIVYRPSNYKLPPSRGREGFEIKKSGEFVRYSIGPDDRSKKIIGHFSVQDSNKLHIRFEEQQLQPITLKILMCDESVLRVEGRAV